MNNITVVLTNWKRPQNILQIANTLFHQTEKPVIYLWDNNPLKVDPNVNLKEIDKLVLELDREVFRRVDWYVNSSENKECLPRWWMAERATTPYVVIMDDDLVPADNNLLADLLGQLDARSRNPYEIVGAFGKTLVPSLTYEQCPAAVPGNPCDIVLGRFMAMRTKNLRRALSWNDIGDNDYGKVDDIVLCGMFRNRGLEKRMHYCSEVFTGRLTELPAEHAICKEPGHFVRREKARRIWFDI